MEIETKGFDIKSLILYQISFGNLPLLIAMNVVQNQINDLILLKAAL